MPESTARIAAAAQQLPSRLRALETRHAHAAARPLAQALADVQADATTRWLHATTPAQPVPLRDQLEALIAHIRQALAAAFKGKGTAAMREAQRAAYTAASLGLQHASRITAMLRGVPPTALGPETGRAAERAAAAIPAAVEAEHTHALALLTTASLTAYGAAGLAAVFTRARRAVTRITQHVAVAVTSAAAASATALARMLGPGVRMLWVAEPGACPACAAYAGRTARPGGHFPGGLSLDPRRTVFMTPVQGPPRHPHCRCIVVPYHPRWAASGTPLPLVLQRLARGHAPAPARRT